MATPPRKRPSPSGEEDTQISKRQRIGSSHTVESVAMAAPAVDDVAPLRAVPSFNEQAGSGLSRSIILILEQVGFDSASEEALGSFTALAEIYLQSVIQDTIRRANASRRAQPTPLDLAATIDRFNLSTKAMKPHIRHPIPKAKLQPTYSDALAGHPTHGKALPLIGKPLSGKPEKEARSYIPKSFPAFPSIHTYRYTPTDVESVTVQGSGLRYDDGTPVGEQAQRLPKGPRGDAQKMREAAAREQKMGEEALRSLLRAGKVNRLKEVKAVAARDKHSRERYGLWETAMRDLMEEAGRSTGTPVEGSGAARMEIANHSMMVNAQKVFHRKEVQRSGKKPAQKVQKP